MVARIIHEGAIRRGSATDGAAVRITLTGTLITNTYRPTRTRITCTGPLRISFTRNSSNRNSGCAETLIPSLLVKSKKLFTLNLLAQRNPTSLLVSSFPYPNVVCIRCCFYVLNSIANFILDNVVLNYGICFVGYLWLEVDHYAALCELWVWGNCLHRRRIHVTFYGVFRNILFNWMITIGQVPRLEGQISETTSWYPVSDWGMMEL